MNTIQERLTWPGRVQLRPRQGKLMGPSFSQEVSRLGKKERSYRFLQKNEEDHLQAEVSVHIQITVIFMHAQRPVNSFYDFTY